ncbi:hypothetical protein H0264_21995 [Nocardia huaxiensis]|uniref:Heavy-metal chelation domain-containing protein n=1 Tax=Nocardia huaxiensis TaxID=2755382 RepID=A0A7D6V5P4_9NOCA|nr:DUF364 domain-containing protein [Nocardia huaxiensis]QLY28072.1 hypothetical protein H0264_21995 [Nocardia huaxiensis]
MIDGGIAQRTDPGSLDELIAWTRAGKLGLEPAAVTTAAAFLTLHSTRHAGRNQQYRNEILSIRVGAAVGSCAFEPDDRADHASAVDECVGVSIAELLEHRLRTVRIAALDAYLMHAHPHPEAGGRRAAPVLVRGESSLAKSQTRASGVIDLLPAGTRTVLVIGVVNSLLAQLRSREVDYIPCDLAGGVTEWGEPVHTSSSEVSRPYDALLVTGMCLGNDSFDELLKHARRQRIPMVMFAQTGSAVLPWFLGETGLVAVAAEPYPFFSLDGGPSTHFHYRGRELACGT